MEAELLVKMLTGGSAVTVLGGVVAWLLIRTIPAQERVLRDQQTEHAKNLQAAQDAYRASLEKMAATFATESAAQRDAFDRYNERLLSWLAAKAGLPIDADKA
jgi:type II secretory pathway pseudopilin PulG